MKRLTPAMLAAVLILSACGGEDPVASKPPAVDAATALQALFEEHFERELEMNPIRATFIGDDRYNNRLVVDTGIHSKGWTRQQVLDYMYANSAVAEARAVAEAERFMAIPGQALAYKVGQLKIREIRNNAEARLGDKFDVKAFHTEVLKDGALPLSMLEAKVDRWVEAQM